MAELDKVIKGLDCCMKLTNKPNTVTCRCSDCSYTNIDILGHRCLVDLINDALALLKEYQKTRLEIAHEMVSGSILMYQGKELIRCKDCVYWDKGHSEECDNSDSVCFHNGWCKPDWYCADGERK